MKTTYQLTLFLLLLLASGCKDTLEPKVFSQINATDFPKSESDIKSAFIPFYAQFVTSYGNLDPSAGNRFDLSLNSHYLGYGWSTSVMTDEANDLSNSDFSRFNLGPATVPTTDQRSVYRRLRFVAKATDLIDRIEKSGVPNKALNLAEARGLRAWLMFILYDAYGPLNVKLDPKTLTSNAVEPRLTKEAYLAALEADLQAAIAGLPDKYNGDANNWGRFSKGVGRMILLKLYMQEKQWAKAEAVGKDLMGMGYALNPSYKNVFVAAQNREVIYAAPGSDATVSIWYKCILPFDAKQVLGVAVQDNGYKLNEMPWVFYDKYAPTDKRLETIADSYVNAKGATIGRKNGLSGAIPMKYTNFRPDEKGYDYVMYRYADVLLSMAEISNELRGPSPEAVAFVKQVTDRAGTIIPETAVASKTAFNDFLLAERGRELYWEFGIRRQDLIRHGKLISNARARGFTNAQDFHVLWPIPSDVIIESKGIIKQNPGYPDK